MTAIKQYLAPITKRELMCFLGLVGYYHSFCRNFSTVCIANQFVEGKSEVCRSISCQQAFENVKAVLCSSLVFAALRLDQPFDLQPDASDVIAGAVLLQRDCNSVAHSVSFISKKFNSYQLNHSVI